MMYPPTHKPTETTYERQELLRQERRNRRLTRRREARSEEFRSEEFRSEEFSPSEPRMAGLGQAALSTMLALALMIAGLIAAVVVGPGEAISWVVTYLMPTLVILGVVVGTIFLVAWEGGKAYDTRYPHK
jgi:Flp pilus assembly protein TadB